MSFGRQRHPHVHFNISQYYIYLLVIWEMSTLGKIFIAPLWRIRLFYITWCNFQSLKTIINEFNPIAINTPSWNGLKIYISEGFNLNEKVGCHHYETFNFIYGNIKSLTTVNWHGETYGNGGIYLWRCCWGCIFVFLVLYIVFAKKYVSIVIGKMFVYLKLQRKWGESERNNVYRLADESFKCNWIKQRSSR